jgi:hypothetical protein
MIFIFTHLRLTLIKCIGYSETTEKGDLLNTRTVDLMGVDDSKSGAPGKILSLHLSVQ